MTVTHPWASSLSNSPLRLLNSCGQVYDVQTVTSSALPYQGRYPCASLAYKGIYYVGTYAIAETWGRTTDEHGKPVPLNRQYLCGNWCVLGPFVGFRHARIEARPSKHPLTFFSSL